MSACAASLGISFASAAPALMPWPAHVEWHEGELPIAAEFRVRIAGHDDARLRAGIGRALDRLEKRTELNFGPRYATEGGTLVVTCAAAGSAIPRLGDDESYTLEVRSGSAELRSPNVVGALRGLETFLQLVEARFDVAQASRLPAFAAGCVVIRDAPRFPWRGLMIDVARHFQPPEVLHRNLDAMAAVKLNVLHLHLTDDQGFRIESKRHPELPAVSADGASIGASEEARDLRARANPSAERPGHHSGDVLTQEQIKALIAAAAERGIRVVPEFDVPGHTTAWLASHPEIASAPGPHAVARRWGVLDDVMDPTLPETHALLESFFGEMAALFPDEFFHIGGDENNGKQWNASARIAAFKRERGLATNEALHAWFNQQLAVLLAQHGKRLVGWDEVLHPDLPRSAVVHSWRGPESLARAAQEGFAGILSAGYYLDLHYPAADHYAADPLPEGRAATPLAAERDGAERSPRPTLTPEQAARVLGGEAAMWTEWADAQNFDFRVWPRAVAVAERLWSPREVRDVADMYRRLARVDELLVETGVQHRAWPRFEGFSAEDATALRVLASAVEPVKRYRRPQIQKGGADFPLNELADWAHSESRPAREFAERLDRWGELPAAEKRAALDGVLAPLAAWRAAATQVAAMPAPTEFAAGRNETARRLVTLCETAGKALRAVANDGRFAAEEAAQARELLKRAAQPTAAAVEFPFLPALERLVAAAEVAR
ncbi:MAG: family 20 glycosylhydrolase [Opitutae bacterium]|nr:family 20 glycosylhydrolase [Opitutae bacterium]